MSPRSMKTSNDLLRGDNYSYWEFNARMRLDRKNLLDHIRGPEFAKEEGVIAVAVLN